MTTLTEAVSGAELDRHLRAISRVVRLSGTAEEAEAFDYIEGQLRAFGYRVNRHASDALIGYPQRSSLEILSPNPVQIASNGYSLSPSTGPEGVTGEVVFVGAGMPGDFEGRDVQGKIVVSDGLAMPGKALAAERAGAIGQIHINDEHIHEMCISPVWGTPTPETGGLLPKVPAVGISRPDGDRLKGLLQQGAVRVRLATEPFRAWVKIPTLTADLPGTASDDFVMFSGHVDSWHYGVMDNGTANATQLEVARLLAERGGELRRGVRFAFWSGHSHGRYASSTWYADTFWHDLHANCACHVNVDSVGAIGASILEEAPTMAETYGFGRQVLADTVGAELDYRRISRSSDQSFWGHGIPTVFASLSEQARDDSATGAALAQLLGAGGKSGGLGWWWHTTEDTLDKIDPGNFVRDAGVYAETLWRLCTVDRLPIEPAAAAEEMAHTLARYHADARGTLDLSGIEALAREAATAIAAFSRIQRDPEATNQLTMALCRLLIPVNYTRSGPFEHDLALRSDPLPGLSDAAHLGSLDRSSDDFFFLRTKLMRERNRVEHALRSALRLVEMA
ncbi:MAG: N-acetylated-alpha-linked acidic dipeptidase [Thermomicrobiales bacterium]|nr:N-acetylated-alpha-linked acidic dipeptidase [Thermomicrobiales bacterium]